MTTWQWCIAFAAVFAGSCAQGSFGFGLGVTAAPVLALIDGDFIPGPLLLVAMLLTVLVAWRERAALVWRPVGWAMVGRVPGSVLGTWAVVMLPERNLVVLFAVLVLVGVGLSAAGWSVAPRRSSLLSAGAASGLMGSVTSIGGPPMALLYQRSSGQELRSSLSLFFLFGSALSVSLLALAGQLHGADVGRAVRLAPAMLVGFAVSRVAVKWLDGGRLRPWLLGFSACTAMLLLLTEIF